MNELKIKAAQAAIQYITQDMVVGVGTGSTVNFFIKELASIRHKIHACIPSSNATEALLRAVGLPIIDLNEVAQLPIYVDGADEVNDSGEMIKGGGGALTREKIIATVAKQFICIVDESKVVAHLGAFGLAIEVIPMARAYVTRQLVALGGKPQYREHYITDNGNIILDVYHLPMDKPQWIEAHIKSITGVVENGLFAHRVADQVLVATQQGICSL